MLHVIMFDVIVPRTTGSAGWPSLRGRTSWAARESSVTITLLFRLWDGATTKWVLCVFSLEREYLHAFFCFPPSMLPFHALVCSPLSILRQVCVLPVPWLSWIPVYHGVWPPLWGVQTLQGVWLPFPDPSDPVHPPYPAVTDFSSPFSLQKLSCPFLPNAK